MDDRKALERKWREEFDESGEEGVREKLFRGTFLANQRKEAFAYRWLGEKRKEQERRNSGLSIRIGLVGGSIFVVLVVFAAAVLLIGGGEILDKAGSALWFSWKAIAGFFGASP